MFRPIPLTERKVDVIIGNPPWIAQHALHNGNYKKYLKERSMEYGLIEKNKVHNIPNLELASLFFCHCTSQYLNHGGVIGFVMPRSILDASQHASFRKFQNPLMNLFQVYDLEKVQPMFRIPSCVIFAKKGSETKFPVKMIEMDGQLNSSNEQIVDASKSLKNKISEFTPIIRDRKNSPYHKKFKKGADLIPRIFWYVDIKSDSFLGFNPENPHIVSSYNKHAKSPWKEMKMEGNVAKEFLFNTLVATDLVPFGILQRRLVFLPIIIKNGDIDVFDSFNHPQISNTDTSKYLENVEDIWKKYSKGTANSMTTYQWINYQGKLAQQNIKYNFKVVFAGSATYMTAAVLKPKEPYSIKINELEFKTNNFIADYATYYFDTNDENEAHYLVAVLNSKIIDDLIKPEQSKGNFGPRNINKLPLTFDIPTFNPSSLEHAELAKLSMACKIKVDDFLLKT